MTSLIEAQNRQRPKTGIEREKFNFPADFRSVFVLAVSSAGRTTNAFKALKAVTGIWAGAG